MPWNVVTNIRGADGDAGPGFLWLASPGPLFQVIGRTRAYLPAAGTITNIHASCGTPTDDGDVIVDVNLNGTTVFTTQANRPAIGTTGLAASNTPDVSAFDEGDYLTFDIDDPGSLAGDLVLRIDVSYGS